MKARIAALALLAVCAGTAWLDARSPASAALRAGRPVWGLAALRPAGQGAEVAPALYLLYLDARRGTLDAARLPPGTPAVEPKRTLADAYSEGGAGGMAAAAAAAAAATPGWNAGAEGPLFKAGLTVPSSAAPSDEAEAGRGLARIADDPLFWLRLPGRLRRSRASGLGAYDAVVLARAVRAAGPRAVRTSRWPAPESAPAFAQWLAEGRAAGDARGVTTLEVLNAGGPPGVALRATKVLRLRGFDVVHFGNAPALADATAAVDRVGHPEAARAALEALGCPEPRATTALEAAPMTMASVTLGRDYASCARLHDGAAGREGE